MENINEIKEVTDVRLIQSLTFDQPGRGLACRRDPRLLETPLCAAAALQTQTRAGRVALFELLPLSFEELPASGRVTADPFPVMLAGGYPAIHDRALDPTFWLADCLGSYLERDVRKVSQVGEILAFQSLLRLAPGPHGDEFPARRR